MKVPEPIIERMEKLFPSSEMKREIRQNPDIILVALFFALEQEYSESNDLLIDDLIYQVDRPETLQRAREFLRQKGIAE